MNIKQFVNKHHVKIESKLVAENKNMPDWKDANHFEVTLKMKGKRFTTYFSMGYGLSGEPTVHDVLDCLANDASGIEDWANEYGYDTDSRKAKKLYNVCVSQSEKLKNFLGDDLYNTLLWKIDRL